MDILFNAVGGFVVEVGKFVCKCIYPKIENIVRFSSKIENLREEMENITKLRDEINGKKEKDELEGYKTKPDVIKWIRDVCELRNEWETMQQSIAAAKTFAYKCWSLRSQVSTQAQKIQDQLSRLKQVGESFGSNLMVENYQMKRVEFIAGPSVEGQSAATRNLNEILRLLEDDKVCIIGVLGPGGVGKTTLVKNLNNELLKINVSNSKLSFGVVVWVTVPKPPNIIKQVQAQIVSRLNLKVDKEGSEISIASKILERLKQEKSFLVILDDVWDAINLDDIGVPQPEPPSRSKVIITSRFGHVCKEMKTNTEMIISILEEDESWQLFIKTAGDVANRENIQPFARDIARECGGLPLAITVIGACMSGKNRVEEWVDALDSLRMSEPYEKNVINKVYKVIKLSFDYLESPDNTGNKRRSDIRSCFLYCSLYPVDIQTDDLINCWWAEGFLGEFDTYEKAYNRGITIIGSLKNACLLEAYEMDLVKMHDVVCDVAKWIANTFGDEHISVFQAGIGLTEISHTTKVSAASVKRISFASNKIEYLPDCFTKCPKTTSLLLQDNESLVKIPDKFFLSFPVLRVLNLSQTDIRALPCSINELRQLHALILQNCRMLKELPSIGDLCNLQLLDCDGTMLHCLPEGMDKLTNLRLLNMRASDLQSSINQGFFLNFSSIEIVDMTCTCLGATSFDELSSLHNLTCLYITLDSSSIFNRDHTWMKRLKRFCIKVGKTSSYVQFNKSRREIIVSECETFSNGELSGMLQFASDLVLVDCMGLGKLIANKKSTFNGLKSLYIYKCCCDFGAVEEGISGQIDPLPNLEYLRLCSVDHLKSVSDFGHFLGLRFSKLRKLIICYCPRLTCLFNAVGSAPKHLEEIEIDQCVELVDLSLANSETPRVRKLSLINLPKLATFGEAQSMWEQMDELEVIGCYEIKKLPLSIQTSNNIKLITGSSEWWSQLEWDDDNFKSNLEHCFKKLRNIFKSYPIICY